MSNRETIRTHAAFIWSVADLLRGDYKQSEYGKVILPMVVLRRLFGYCSKASRARMTGSVKTRASLLHLRRILRRSLFIDYL